MCCFNIFLKGCSKVNFSILLFLFLHIVWTYILNINHTNSLYFYRAMFSQYLLRFGIISELFLIEVRDFCKALSLTGIHHLKFGKNAFSHVFDSISFKNNPDGFHNWWYVFLLKNFQKARTTNLESSKVYWVTQWYY